jgi:hypothetical protein
MKDEKDDGKDPLKDLPVRDLLEMAKPVLDNFILLALVDAGNSPAVSVEHMHKIGMPELASQVKAACYARLKLGEKGWDNLKQTSTRPAKTMLRFSRTPLVGSELIPSTSMVFGGKEFDRSRWPLLLQEFLLPSRKGEKMPYLTTLDFTGKHGSYVHNDSRDLFNFMLSSSSDMYRGCAKVGKWQIDLSDKGISWVNNTVDHSYSAYSKTILMAPKWHKQMFPKCCKVLEIVQYLGNKEGRERVRILIELCNTNGSDNQLAFEKLVPLNDRWEAKLSIAHHLILPYRVCPGEEKGFTVSFSQYEFCQGFLSVGYKDTWGFGEGPSSPPFNLKITGNQDPFRPLLELAERISAVKELDLETIAGQAFLDNPPEFLHDLFVKK